MIYQWRSGVTHRTDPQVAGSILTELSEAGKLNAKELVDISRPEDAPLHQEFEWDDTTAAENWRQHQGRNIINALMLVPEQDEDEQKEPVRAFFKIETYNRESYEATEVLVRSQDGREALRKQAMRELQSYRQKYRTVLEWTGAEEPLALAVGMLTEDVSA